MKTIICFVLVLSTTYLHAQERSEGLQIKLDAIFSSETFCVRNLGYLFVFDRKEFFGKDIQHPNIGLAIPPGDTLNLDASRNPESFGDPHYVYKQYVRLRMTQLLDAGRANVYTPDGRTLRALDMVYQQSVAGLGSWYKQRYFVPDSEIPVLYYFISFTSGCPSF